ncbi:MAG: methyltransferase [Actinomycetota bacterium]|nr:methyltransferase [Actinomycetota bacterium]
MTTSPPPETLLQLSSAHVSARALHVIAELGVADLLDAEPRTTADLTVGTAVDADALDRLLRLLETHGVFARDHADRWQHTETSRWLRSDHPMSMRAFARMMGMPFGWGSFTALEHAARTGNPSIRTLHPDGAWAYLEGHPDEQAIFQQSMTAKSQDDIPAILAAYDFAKFRCIADIGAGRGHLISAVLDSYSKVSGVLFDLPQVTAEVPAGARLNVVAGDFFTDPLPACDAYILMNILHDWNDSDAVNILSAVADAGRPCAATVLIIETVLPEGPEPHWAKVLDVMMLALTGGRERTLSEYEDLLSRTGMEPISLIPTTTPFSILEGRVR